MPIFIFILSFFTSSHILAQAFEVPSLKAYVNDYAHVMTSSYESELNEVLAAVKKQTGVELAILTVNSLEGTPLESASIQVVDSWKLGTAKEDKGVLLLLAIKDRKIRIEVGQGLEGDLTDAYSRRIIDEVMVPLLKAGNYNEAIYLGAYNIVKRALPEVDVVSQFFRQYGSGSHNYGQPSSRHSRDGKSKLGQILIFWLFLIIIFGRFGLWGLFFLGGGPRGRGPFGGSGFGGGGFGGGFGGGSLGGGGGFSGGGASGGW